MLDPEAITREWPDRIRRLSRRLSLSQGAMADPFGSKLDTPAISRMLRYSAGVQMLFGLATAYISLPIWVNNPRGSPLELPPGG